MSLSKKHNNLEEKKRVLYEPKIKTKSTKEGTSSIHRSQQQIIEEYKLMVNSKTAVVSNHEPESKLEKIPFDILKNIISFIPSRNRNNLVLVSTTLRKIVRNTATNIKNISFSYQDLVMFLGNNLDLNVTALTVNLTNYNSPDNINELKPYLSKINNLEISCDKDSKDLSALSLCNKLNKLCITKGHFLEHIKQCEDLDHLTMNLISSPRIVMNFTNLKTLDVRMSTGDSLDITNCIQLDELNIESTKLKTINPPQNIKNIKVLNNTELDASFLGNCRLLESLDINTVLFDLEHLEKLNYLYYLRINTETIEGDFRRLNNITNLHLILKGSLEDYKELPELPPNLTHFKLWMRGYANISDISTLSGCPKLKVLEISCGNGTSIYLRDLSGCNLLEALNINCKILHNDRCLQKFPLVSLSLTCENDSFESKFADYPLLEYLHLSSRITDLEPIKNCTQLRDLFVSGSFKTSQITSCTNLVTLGILTNKKTSYKLLLELKNLTNLYTDVDKIGNSLRDKLEKRDIKMGGYIVSSTAYRLEEPIRNRNTHE